MMDHFGQSQELLQLFLLLAFDKGVSSAWLFFSGLRSLPVSAGLCWSTLVSAGLHWSLLVSAGVCWSLLVSTGNRTDFGQHHSLNRGFVRTLKNDWVILVQYGPLSQAVSQTWSQLMFTDWCWAAAWSLSLLSRVDSLFYLSEHGFRYQAWNHSL